MLAPASRVIASPAVPDQHAEIVRLDQLGDAFAGSHRFANPVIQVAVDENPVMAGLHINTAKKFVDIGEFKDSSREPCRADRPVPTCFAGCRDFWPTASASGTRDGQRLRSNVATVAQGGVIEREVPAPV